MNTIKESSDELNPAVAIPATEIAPRIRRTVGDYFALAIATCGVGYFPIAPGTLGSIVGVLIYLLLRFYNEKIVAMLFPGDSFLRFDPQPIFFARAVEPVAPPRVANEKHLIFRLRQGDRYRRAVYFDGAATEFPPVPWDVAFRIGVDQYEGQTLVAMRIEAVRAAERL